jgi:hypothetical protein
MRVLARLKTDQRGIGLAESLVGVAVLGVAGVAFAVALSTGSLVQSQLEYTKSYPYDPEATTYPLIAVPAGYELAVSVSAVPGTDSDIQQVTVTASREGEPLLTVADYKVNR